MTPWLDENRLAQLYPAHVAVQAERTARALARAGLDRLIIFAGSERLAFRDDTAYPFIANPYFKAWLPLVAHPDSALVITPGARPRLLYMQSRDFWHMPPGDPTGYWIEQFAITTVANRTELLAALPSDLGTCAVIGEDIANGCRCAAINDPLLLNELDYQRAIKTPYEQECIAAANRRAAAGHRAARQAFLAGDSEFAIHQAYCRAVQHTDNELPYANIIAVNEHAAVLHYQLLDREPPAHPATLLIDAGATCQGYAADITRTWTTATEFAPLIDAMDSMQRSLCAQIRAGVDFVTLHDSAHRAIARLLVDGDIVRSSPDETYDSGVSRYFLPHGLGHLLGVQVHDVGGHLAAADGTLRPPPEHYAWLRLTRTLEEGFVLTVEPGIYFIELLLAELAASPAARLINWPRIEQLKALGGIRIEDNVVAEPDGHRNLTREALDT